jgi:hypothetical protein
MNDGSFGHIDVWRRFRRDLGNRHSLADSIDEVGLLRPVIVMQGRLIASRRGLESVRLLRWRTVSMHVVHLENIARRRAEMPRNSGRGAPPRSWTPIRGYGP